MTAEVVTQNQVVLQRVGPIDADVEIPLAATCMQKHHAYYSVVLKRCPIVRACLGKLNDDRFALEIKWR
eukprot:COSAG06_NODE_42373_length_382_cov_0.858657_1_plen_69_part_00